MEDSYGTWEKLGLASDMELDFIRHVIGNMLRVKFVEVDLFCGCTLAIFVSYGYFF